MAKPSRKTKKTPAPPAPPPTTLPFDPDRIHRVPITDDHTPKANPTLHLFLATNVQSGRRIKIEAQTAYRARNYAANHFNVDPTSVEMKLL